MQRQMKILVVNCGSSSLKYQLIDMKTEEVIASGKYQKIGEEGSFLIHKAKGQKIEIQNQADSHLDAIEFALKQLMYPEYRVIQNLDEIDAIGNRIVHGGEHIKEAVLVDDNVKEMLKDCIELAPLHNPAALEGIKALEKVMPGKPMTVVVDTAFHQTMPEERFLYPIPYKYYEKDGVRKYGFHGTSHKYVSNRLAEITNEDIEKLRIVTCHLGQGSSICAIKGGKSMDTSMGLTPLGGIPMITRCGDIDPSVVLYLMKKENISANDMEEMLNKKAGVLSITDGEGISSDFRDLEIAADNGDKKSQIAIEIFEYAVAQYIAKYAVTLDGIDYIIFTGGVGENQYNIRKKICDKLKFLGVEIDEEGNKVKSEEKLISKATSKIKVYVIPTNEELMIARETEKLVKDINK